MKPSKLPRIVSRQLDEHKNIISLCLQVSGVVQTKAFKCLWVKGKNTRCHSPKWYSMKEKASHLNESLLNIDKQAEEEQNSNIMMG